MTVYNVVLFLHFLTVAAVVTAAIMLHAVGFRIRAAQTLAEIRPWAAVTGKIVRLFPFIVLGLVGTGAFLTQEEWTWTAPWIYVSIVGLAINQALGLGVSAKRGRALRRELDGAPDGPVSSRVDALARDPLAWSSSLATTGITVSIIFMMTTKPGLLGSIIVLTVGAVAGVASAVPFWARRQAERLT
jgi:hypothetical protein